MDRPRCEHCGEIVGVYEPMRLLLADGTDQRGSVLTLGDQLTAPGTTVVHEGCSEGFERAREPGPRRNRG